jgi:hypothetical protein
VAEEQGRRPARVRVTSPRTVARRPRPTEVGRQIDDQTGLGEVYMRSLIRTQLRLAAGVLGLVLAPLAALPLVFVAAPAVRETTLLGLPLPWMVLAVLVYPSAVVAGWWYARRAERAEREFTELVDRT